MAWLRGLVNGAGRGQGVTTSPRKNNQYPARQHHGSDYKMLQGLLAGPMRSPRSGLNKVIPHEEPRKRIGGRLPRGRLDKTAPSERRRGTTYPRAVRQLGALTNDRQPDQLQAPQDGRRRHQSQELLSPEQPSTTPRTVQESTHAGRQERRHRSAHPVAEASG
jgi:hypothetical protein